MNRVPAIARALLSLTVVAIVALVCRQWASAPEYMLLWNGANSVWLGHQENDPLLLGHTGLNTARFRARLAPAGDELPAQLQLHTPAGAAVFLDGTLLYATHRDPSSISGGDIGGWTRAHTVSLPSLSRGEHVLELSLASYSGLPVFLMKGLAAGVAWESSGDGRQWLPAGRAAVNAAYARLTEGGGSWLRLNPALQQGFVMDGTASWLRRAWVTAVAQPASVMELSCLRQCRVWLDASELPLDASPDWKQPLQLQLPPLPAGRHELRIRAQNRDGLAAVRVTGRHGEKPGDWESSADGASWQTAWRLDSGRVAPTSAYFPTVASALTMLSPLLLLAGLLVIGLMRQWHRAPGLLQRLGEPGNFRHALLLAWMVLGLHNLPRIPVDFGFDSAQHLEYIRFLAQYRAIPLATDGWQMFQSPLYYLLSAALQLAAEPWWQGDGLTRVLRLLPLLCGAIHIDIVYRSVKLVFPGEPGIQRLATLIGGFMPMSLYMSQTLGNEPLAACLTGFVILQCLRLRASADRDRYLLQAAAIGAAWGLALLAKVTPLLLAPVLLAVVWERGSRSGEGALRIAAAAALLGVAAMATSGWYYLGNWLALGSPFVGGWDPARGILWSQPPGYRMPQDLLSFGRVLQAPVYSASAGFWDGLYSTLWLDGMLSGKNYGSASAMQSWLPWNPLLMVAGAGLAILPSLLIARGAAVALWQREPALRIALACLVIYLGALAQMYLLVPGFSVLKASYTLGLLPCYALLAGAGLRVWWQSPGARSLLSAGIACWWAVAYLSYWSR